MGKLLTLLGLVFAAACTSNSREVARSGAVQDSKSVQIPAATPNPSPLTYDEPELAKLKPGEYTWTPERAPRGPVVVLVNLPQQQARVYRNGILIGRTTVSTGRKGHRTPTGVFQILQKDKHHHSNKYNDASMPNMERLTWDGIALHAGNLPGYPASHGCVRMPLKLSELLFAITDKGGTVVIADDHSAPGEVTHPGMALLWSSFDKTDESELVLLPKGKYVWQPELSPEGPLSILISYSDKMVYTYRNGILIGRAVIQIKDPDQPLQPGVFIVLDGFSEEKNVYVPEKPLHRWMAVGLPAKDGGMALRQDIIDRVRLPKDFAGQVFDLIEPGTTLMVTDLPATPQTTTPRNFRVMTSDG